MNNITAGSFALLTTVGLIASAQAENIQNLDDVLVTASRAPIAKDQTGSSYTVITAEQIEQSQQVQVHELLRTVPGIAVSRSGGIGSQTQIRMRGAEADQTLILIDGIEANDPGQGSSFDFAHLLTADIERIEILRGPQSALWGSDAMGGVINIITKSATRNQLNATLEAGSYSTVQNTISGSVAGDRYGIAVNGNFLRSAGINVSEQGDEEDGYRNSTLNLKANFNPFDNLDLLFTARKSASEKDFDPTSFITSKPVDGDRISDVDQFYSQFNAVLDTLDGHWQHVFNIAWTKTDNDNFADGVENSSTNGEKRKVSYQSNFFFDTPSFAEAEHTLSLALEYEREEFKQTGTASTFGNPNQEQDLSNRGVIGEYRISLLKQIHASASIRHDNNDAFDDATTWRTNIAWAIPNTGSTVRAAYGTAVKNPSFTERFGFTPDTFFGNTNLEPEESKGWEIGLDQSFLQDRLTASVTYFKERLENEINGFVFDPTLGTFGGFTAQNVQGDSKRHGVELALNAIISDALSMNGMLTYVDSTQPDANGEQIRELRRPEYTAAFGTNYRFFHNKASVNLDISYTDTQNDSDFSTFPATLVTLDDYVLVNIATEYAVHPRVTLFGRIDNLLDDDYRDVYGYNTTGIAGYAGFRVSLY